MLNININEKLEEAFGDLELYLEDNLETLKESYDNVIVTIDRYFRHFEKEASDLFLRKQDPHYNYTILTLHNIFPDLTVEQIREQKLTKRGLKNNDRLRDTGTTT